VGRKPHFELARVWENGVAERPQIVPVTSLPWDTRMGRRGSLGMGFGITAALYWAGERLPGQTVRGTEHVVLSHHDVVTALAFSPDGRTLLSGSGDRQVKLWTLADGQIAHVYRSVGAAQAILISADGRTAFVPTGTSVAKLLPAARSSDGASIGEIAALSADGFTLVTAVRNEVWVSLLNREFGAPLQLRGHTETITSVAVTPNGRVLVSGSRDQTVRLWLVPENYRVDIRDTRTITQLLLRGHTDTVTAVAVSGDGAVAVSASDDGTVRLWSLPTGRAVATLTIRELPPGSEQVKLVSDGRVLAINPWSFAKPQTLAASPDGRWLAVCLGDDTIRLFSLPEGRPGPVLSGEKERIRGMLFPAGGQTLVSWSSAGAVTVWSLPGGEFAARLEAGAAGVYAVAASPNGKLLASGHAGGVIALWDLEQREFRGFLFDPEANRTDGLVYTQEGVTYALACGATPPPGSVCTCNCVLARYTAPPPPPTPGTGGGGGGGGGCTCNPVCTCIPVFR
jgi:WD40 repeat protein